MLKEQRDIFLELANDLWEQKKEEPFILDEFKGLEYGDLITKKIGDLHYTLRFYIQWNNGFPVKIYLEGAVEVSEFCMVPVYSEIQPSATIDLHSSIEKFKAAVKERYDDVIQSYPQAVHTRLSEEDTGKIKELIWLVLKHIGHGTDSFIERGLEFFKLIKTYKVISFSICDEWELAFAFLENKDGDADIALRLYGFGIGVERNRYLKIEQKLSGFNERNAHLAFLSIIGRFQDKLRQVK